MRFLVDAQLPPNLAAFLREHGHEAQAVRDVALRSAVDRDIWDFARREGMVVVTKDEDFANRAMAASTQAPVIVWLRVGNCSNRALRQWFTPMLPRVVAAIQNGDKLVELV